MIKNCLIFCLLFVIHGCKENCHDEEIELRTLNLVMDQIVSEWSIDTLYSKHSTIDTIVTDTGNIYLLNQSGMSELNVIRTDTFYYYPFLVGQENLNLDDSVTFIYSELTEKILSLKGNIEILNIESEDFTYIKTNNNDNRSILISRIAFNKGCNQAFLFVSKKYFGRKAYILEKSGDEWMIKEKYDDLYIYD